MDSSRKLPGNCHETAQIANHYVPPLVIRMYSTGLLFISVSFGKKNLPEAWAQPLQVEKLPQSARAARETRLARISRLLVV